MTRMSQSAFSPELNRLLEAPGPADLGPRSRPNTFSQTELKAQLELALNASKLSSRSLALIHGAFLLWHDHLDAAHKIAQEFEDADGSLLHAMMHRREPDFFNAKYWFRRVGQHPCFADLSFQAKTLFKNHPKLAAELLPGDKWDPFAFVDACERAESNAQSAETESLRLVQQIETEALLKHLLHVSR